MYPLADLHWYPGQELIVETNSTGEKSKLLSQLERDGKFWVQKSSRRIRPVHSLCRHRSDHGLCYAMACGNKTKSPDGHRKWDLDYDATGDTVGATAIATKQQVSLSWLDHRNANSNLTNFSQEQKKWTSLTLLISILFRLSTAIYTPPRQSCTNGHTSKQHQLKSQLKNSCSPHQFLLFLQSYFKLRSIQWSDIITKPYQQLCNHSQKSGKLPYQL